MTAISNKQPSPNNNHHHYQNNCIILHASQFHQFVCIRLPDAHLLLVSWLCTLNTTWYTRIIIKSNICCNMLLNRFCDACNDKDSLKSTATKHNGRNHMIKINIRTILLIFQPSKQGFNRVNDKPFLYIRISLSRII